MAGVYIESENGTVAVIVRSGADGELKRVATVYSMADGWHAKSADLHTRHAWTGPFVSPAEALSSIAVLIGTPIVQCIDRN